jgi:SAM-dependent methyltransferase
MDYARRTSIGSDIIIHGTSDSIAPFVPSPTDVVRRMLEIAGLAPGELLYDLGCGDGRVVFTAVREFGAKGVGVDLMPRLVAEAQAEASRLGLGDRARFISGNLFDVDLSEADVITMYLLTGANEKVRPKLERELRKGARVVTHDFPITKWDPNRVDRFNGDSGSHTIYLYIWNRDSPKLNLGWPFKTRPDG